MNILFLGASNTDSSHCFTPDFLGHGYVKYIAGKLYTEFPDSFPCGSIVNGGTDGFTFQRMLLKWKQMYQNRHFDLIVLLGGINEVGVMQNTMKDSGTKALYLNDAGSSLFTLLTSLHENTSSHLIVCEPFLFSVPDYLSLWKEDLRSVRHMIRETVSQVSDQILYLETQDVLNQACVLHGLSSITTDGIHLNDIGHNILGELIFHEICVIMQQISIQ